MGLAFKACHWVIVAYQADGVSVTDFVNDLDTAAGFFDAKSTSIKDFLIAFGVQFGESLAELEVLAVDFQGAVGAFLAFHGVWRQGFAIDAEEIADTGLLQFEVTCYTVVRRHVDDVLFHFTEDPTQHVIEMHPDIGGNAAALVDIAFPGSVIPVASGGDIGQVHVIDLVFRTFFHFFSKGLDLVVQAQLENGIGLVALPFFHLLKGIDIPWVEHQGFLTDDIGTEA